MTIIVFRRRRVSAVLVLSAVVFAAMWLAHRSQNHPQFGHIYVARMSESYSDTKPLWQVRQDLGVFVRRMLHLRAPRPPAPSSDHGPNSGYGLRIGTSLLRWNLHANSSTQRNGYIYMRDQRPTGGSKGLWEFALSPKRRLADVTPDDLRCEFYGMADPRGRSVFGAAWEDAAILVPEGQIFLARLAADRSVIYVVRLANQGGKRSGRASMQIEYVAVTNQPSRFSAERMADPGWLCQFGSDASASHRLPSR